MFCLTILMNTYRRNLKKFDLIGIPYQIILGERSIDDKFEFKEINEKTESLSLEEIKNKLHNSRN